MSEAEIDTWDDVARAWRTWWSVIEAGAGALSRRMIELAELGAGQCALDIGTGIGEPALVARSAVGPRGRVVALDRSQSMLTLARERAGDGIELVRSDAVALPFAANTFDGALCRWGLMHVAEPAAVAREARRVIRTGGRWVAAVWGTPDEVPFLSTSRRAVIATLGLPADDSDDGPFRLHDGERLRALLERAGFDAVVVVDVTVALAFASAAEYASFVLAISGWTRRALSDRSDDERESVRAAIESSAREFELADGRVEFINRSPCAVARA